MGAEPPGRVVLVGMMGAGKTTVGLALARRLGWAFADTDELVETRAGRPVAAVFADEGEAAFRDLETAAVDSAMRDPRSSVVALGGGALLAATNRAALAGVTVAWLRAEPATLLDRVGDGHGRPLLADGPSVLARIDAERRVLYEELATVTVDVDGRSVEEIVATVAAAAGMVEESPCRR